MEIPEYLEKKKDLQCDLLKFIDIEDCIEENYQNVIILFNDHKICDSREELQSLLYLLAKISKNHNRSFNFFNKIEQIIQFFRDSIQKYFLNYEIFDIFKNDKRILLFLIKERIIIIDKYLSSIMMNYKYEQQKYAQFFFPELKPFMSDIYIKELKRKQEDNFEEKRKVGENDNYICEIIRKDSIEEFIILVTKKNLKLTQKVEHSIFETNSFLIMKEPTLIEYAAFFGSIQIFKYLFNNNVELTPSLWIYGIHSDNPELIHLLVENHVEPEIKSYEMCLLESIKCHHNDIANYIQNNFLSTKFKLNNNEKIFQYYNYMFFPNDLNQNFTFYYLCKYNYYTLVELLLMMKSIDINSKIIFTIFCFLIKFQKYF